MPLDPPARGKNSRNLRAKSHCTSLRTSVAVVAADGSPVARLPNEGHPYLVPLTRNSVLYVVQTMNGDHAGGIESFWRTLDVKLRYPGLCRLNVW